MKGLEGIDEGLVCWIVKFDEEDVIRVCFGELRVEGFEWLA